ncbi:MurR/RpiR family transcriptional regulator [Mesorhizobium sp. WSM3860]|uniref:MurR/RpiR family transcriptional regulator n=1 Tax=Mesorhizobium sp. WSM3860 TaxID=2029403 RepID=UPI000BB064CF|nr:MurR/RpiR family transcriptional regulator [Mesorhizobium sp. WSM3860]PBC01350.1 transcriptional regulator [Mesorhizobium sp. WSM3860]
MDRPRNLDEIKAAIAKRDVMLPRAMEHVAREVFRKPEMVAFDSASEIARRCHVGTSTVSRLAQHLGFASFRELRRVFQDDLRNRSLQTSKDSRV